MLKMTEWGVIGLVIPSTVWLVYGIVTQKEVPVDARLGVVLALCGLIVFLHQRNTHRSPPKTLNNRYNLIAFVACLLLGLLFILIRWYVITNNGEEDISVPIIMIQPTPTLVPFRLEERDALHKFQWQDSHAGTYQFNQDPFQIILVADSDSYESAPHLSYAISGNFEVQVKLTFTDYTAAFLTDGVHRAGLAIRSQGQPSIEKWYLTAKTVAIGGHGVSAGVFDPTFETDAPKPLSVKEESNFLWLKIKQSNNSFNSYYSLDGQVWNKINNEPYEWFLMSDVEILLFAYSTNDEALTTEFSEFMVIPFP